MPRIPIVTAQTGPGVLQLPAVQRQPGWEEVSEFGARLADIQGRLQAQQDDLDLYRTLTETEAELGQQRLSMAADTDYETQADRFTKTANEIKYRKLGTLRNPSVAAVYQARAERMIAEAGIHIQTDATKRIIEQQQVEFIDLSEQTAQRFAESDAPERRDEIRQTWNDLLNRNQALTPKQREQHQQAISEKAMKYLRLTNRPRLREWQMQGVFKDVDPVKQAEILKHAAEDDEAERRRADAAFTEATRTYMRDVWAEANAGRLTPARIEAMKNNLDPFVDPHQVPAILERNENPIGAGATGPVRAVMLEYRDGSPTLERIYTYRQKLHELIGQGANTTDIEKALTTLQGHEMSLKTATMNQDIRTFEAVVEAESPAAMPGQAGQFQKNKRARETAEGRRAILEQGKSLEEVTKTWRERKRQQKEDQQRRGKTTLHDLSERLGR